MANLTIEVATDFKTIYVKSDDSSMNTNYPVMLVYKDSVLTYTLAVSGSQTIGSTTYTTTSGASNLNFASTTTTSGTEYIHTINAASLGLTAGSVLPDAVWQFKCLDASATTNLFIGAVVHDDIDCCIADKLKDFCDGTCTCTKEELMEEINNVYASLYAAKILAEDNEFTNAECLFKIAQVICEDCNCH